MTRLPRYWRRLLGLALCVLLAGFTAPSGGIGGTGRPQGGIGGTGVTAIGVIQRFGSIFVNGTEYHLRTVIRYRIDGRPASRGALARGDSVFVEGRIRTGYATALSVRVQHAVIGIITASTHQGRVLRVLGQTIDLTTHTVVSPVAVRLKAGMEVAVSGLVRGSGVWRATRVHVLRKEAFGNTGSFLVRGRLEGLAAGRVRIGGARLAVASGHAWPVALGEDVVARGSYRAGRAVITAMRQATTLSDARATRILIAGYFHGRRTAWRYEGVTLRAPASVMLPARHPAFVVVVRRAPHRYVIVQATTPIRVMTFGLPPAVAGSDAQHPSLAHPMMMAIPHPMPPPMVMRPPVMPTMPRP